MLLLILHNTIYMGIVQFLGVVTRFLFQVRSSSFKGGRGGVRFLFRILNTLPHWKDVVLDIYNTAETIVFVMILKILVDLTH